MSSKLQLVFAGGVIFVAAVIIYQGILFPRSEEERYPWSSDNWGHLIKAEYLREQLDDGIVYPDLFPNWYAGQQMLRYFAPLPYYNLVWLEEVTGDIYAAANLFIFLTALGGALSWLLFKKHLGLFMATLGAVLFLFVPDNIRVAFAEGNLPRILAASLLPLAFYFTINMMTEGARKRDFAGLAIVLSIIVLSHAMMVAIFTLGLGLFTITHFMINRTSIPITGRTFLALITGLLIAGWWLGPSATGGISEIDQEAASEAIAFFRFDVAFNPTLRDTNREIFYVGLTLYLIPLMIIPLWKQTPPVLRSVVISGLLIGLISSTQVNEIYKAVPLHQLFWPLRFMSYASLALMFASIGMIGVLHRSIGSQKTSLGRAARLGTIALVILMILDFWPSLQLIHGRERPPEVVEVAENLRDLEGWRVGTADLSRLGSAPSQLFTTVGGREQVFGWAFQGSIVSSLIARINQAMVQEHATYAVNRYERLGTDDIIVVNIPEIGPDFRTGLTDAGYEIAHTTPNIQMFHKDGGPRGNIIEMSILGIGDGVNNLAILFPEIIVGFSPNVDDYTPEFLNEFDTLVLSRFSFNSRAEAEKMVTDFAASGKKVIIDITGAPLDPLSREPKFLGVYGEPIIGISRANLILNGAATPLQTFTEEFGPWRSTTPQGVEQVLIPFEFPAAEGVLIGRNTYGDGEVDFIGLNLMFHAVITSDPLAIRILEAELDRTAKQRPADIAVPLKNYQATEAGWSFDTELDAEHWVLFPMANHVGTRVLVDGVSVEELSIETLTFAKIPAGLHSVQIISEKTTIYTIGRAMSVVGGLILVAYVTGLLRRPGSRRRRKDAAPIQEPSGA
ncbi:MAG: hypothetical protein HQ478_11220 [Chloroflexi bacterium]|nr:hypothetical protein [Chloroflexota bacterium]